MLGIVWIDQRGAEMLDRAECLRLLAIAAQRDGFGRIAVSRPGAPVVQPANFRLHEGLVVVRLGDGFMAGAAEGQLVAFEADGIDRHAHEGGGAVAWSVLVRGLATRVDADGWRQHGPQPFVPVPGDAFLTIRPDVISGRRFGILADRQSSREPVAGA